MLTKNENGYGFLSFYAQVREGFCIGRRDDLRPLYIGKMEFGTVKTDERGVVCIDIVKDDVNFVIDGSQMGGQLSITSRGEVTLIGDGQYEFLNIDADCLSVKGKITCVGTVSINARNMMVTSSSIFKHENAGMETADVCVKETLFIDEHSLFLSHKGSVKAGFLKICGELTLVDSSLEVRDDRVCVIGSGRLRTPGKQRRSNCLVSKDSNLFFKSHGSNSYLEAQGSILSSDTVLISDEGEILNKGLINYYSK